MQAEILILLTSLGTAASAAGNHTERAYLGRDQAKWTLRLASKPSSGGLVYAGGQYPITIAQTAVDSEGNEYAIGAWVPVLQTTATATQVNTLRDVFVSKTSPSGAIIYTTYLGGRGDNVAMGIAVDSAGNVYGVGNTTSPDFPLLRAIQSATSSALSAQTGFVFKLDVTGALVWSTYFGGSGPVVAGSSVNAVATDAGGDAYVTGTSNAGNFPATPGAFQTNGHVSSSLVAPAASAFAAKVSPSGAIVYATWLAGSQSDCVGGLLCEGFWRQDSGTAIAVDSGGSAYVAGYTNSVDFPVTPGAFQSDCNCNNLSIGQLGGFGSDPFVVKLKPDGSGLVYGTYLGTLNESNPLIAVDNSGDAYIAGTTASAQFPVTSSVLQSNAGGGTDTFVSALNPTGTALLFSTYLGGTGDESPTGLAVDSSGDIFLSGTTSSPNFRDSYGVFPASTGFLLELAPGAKQIVYSMRLPQGAADRDVELDPTSGAILAAGSSGYLMRLSNLNGAELPPIIGIGNAATGTVDNAVSSGELVSIYGSGLGPKPAVAGQPTNGQFPDSLGNVQVLFHGTAAPLTYVSATQVNAVVAVDSSNLYTSPLATIGVINNGATVGQITLPQVANQPGIFSNGMGGTAVNQDGSLNTASNPAKGGSIVSIWATGVSRFSNDDGYVSTSAVNVYQSDQVFSVISGITTEPFGATAYGVYPVTYAGPAPRLIESVFQINFQLPAVTNPGTLPVLLLAGGAVSSPVTVYVTP